MKLENQELTVLLNELSGRNKNGEFDCLVPISGGKDGSFILWYIKKFTKLRVLAFHIDNWYIAQQAKTNVDKLTRELNCELIIQRPVWNLTRQFYRKLLLSMGEICIACELFINYLPLKCAVEKNIPAIIWGLTPNQLVNKNIKSGIRNIDYKFYYDLLEYYKQIIATIFIDSPEIDNLISKFVGIEDKYKNVTFPQFIFPFYYLNYDAKFIEKTIIENTSWKRAKTVGGTSSNCVINHLHIDLKKQIKGKEFYDSVLQKKLKNNEVTEDVVKHAQKKIYDTKLFSSILLELGIQLTSEELISQIKSYKKNIILRKESNISQ